MVGARLFSCSTEAPRRSFNRAANSILGKLGGSSSEDVIIQLIKTKCLPVLLYGTEACSLNKAKLSSLDFNVIKFGMKIFRSGNRLLVIECLNNFGVSLPSESVGLRVERLHRKFTNSSNFFCKIVNLS